jgi:hypothetical protein
MTFDAGRSFAFVLFAVIILFPAIKSEAHKKQPLTAEERILASALSGKPADFTNDDDEARTIHSSVIENIFADENKRKKLSRLGFTVKHAIFKGYLNLGSVEVPITLHWENCEFDDAVNFSSSHFFAPVYLNGSKFTNKNTKLTMNNARFDDLLNLNQVTVAGGAEFFQATIKGNLFASDDTFANENENIRFDQADVKGKMFLGEVPDEEGRSYKASTFAGALSLADVKALELNLSGVTIKKKLDLRHANIQTVLDLNVGCFDRPGKLCLPREVLLEGLSYEDLQPVAGNQLLALIDNAEGYSARSYTQLEQYYRTHAQPEAADDVFFRMKRKEREKLKFLPWLWSLMLRGLVGYGRYPENALYYSFAFIVIGTLIFWRRENVVPRSQNDTSQTYSPFWYSFDLLTPFIDLHQADFWMPRQDWQFGRVYAHVHRILGWILVPIGIAAITGIIK